MLGWRGSSKVFFWPTFLIKPTGPSFQSKIKRCKFAGSRGSANFGKFPAFIVDHIDEEIKNKLTGKLTELLKCETFEVLTKSRTWKHWHRSSAAPILPEEGRRRGG